MSVFLSCLIAILVWRLFSDLTPIDYNKIREIVKEEIKNEKHRTIRTI